MLISAVLSPLGKPFACLYWVLDMIRVCRDPGDDKLLEIAIVGRADCLVTGDQDVLVLDPFQGIPIVTPAGFLATVSQSIDPAD